MKKLDLLKIIKEEIDIALSETTNVLVTDRLGKTTPMPFNTPADKKTVDTLKSDSNITGIKTTAGQKIKEAELEEEQEGTIEAEIKKLRKKLADLEQKRNMNEVELEEEQLDEMAKITEPIEKAIGVAVNRIKAQFPEITPEDITKIITSKKKQGEFAPELKAALDKDEEIHGGDEKYTAGLGGPQALGAVKKAFGGFEVGKRGAKPKSQPTSTPSTSTSPPEPSTSPSDMTDDEGNKVEIDNTVKPVTGNADIEAELKRVISSKKSKLATAKGADYDRELAALKQFLTKPEISKYIKKKTVDGVNPYSIDSILKN